MKDRGGVNNHNFKYSLDDRKSATSWPISTGWDSKSLVGWFVGFSKFMTRQNPNSLVLTGSVGFYDSGHGLLFCKLQINNAIIRNIFITSSALQYVLSKPTWLGCWIGSRGYYCNQEISPLSATEKELNREIPWHSLWLEWNLQPVSLPWHIQ